MDNANMLKPALIGGVALGILSVLPVLNLCNCVCCAWAIGGGILAAYLYIKDSQVPVTTGRGAVVGLASGAIGAVVFGLFSIPISLISNGGGSAAILRAQVQALMLKIPNLPQENIQLIENFIERPDLMMLSLIFNFIAASVWFSLFAMLGGAIGAAVFEKRKLEKSQPNILQ